MFENDKRILMDQMRQLANSVNFVLNGGFPSDTKHPSEGHINAITTRSGVIVRGADETVENRPDVSDSRPDVMGKPDHVEELEKVFDADPSKTTPSKSTSMITKTEKKKPEVVYPPPPFPQRLVKQKEEQTDEKIVDEFSKLEVNTPFLKTLKSNPSYAKILKEFLSNKKDLSGDETVALTKSCNMLIKNQMSPELQDPNAFRLPCVIGNTSIGNALCDMNASINLMPLSIFEKLGISEDHIKDTMMMLHHAGRLCAYTYGIVENVLVKINEKLVFPTDFVICDMGEDEELPIILGRPFLATSQSLIDVYTVR